MATLALGVAFAAGGAALGSAGVLAGVGITTAATGAALGFSIGTAVGDYIFAPSFKAQGPRLQDLSVQGSSYGASIPTVWGAVRIAGQIVWSSGIKEAKNESSGGGGKGGFGGGGGGSITTYSYSASFAVMLCEGPVAGIRRLWADKNLIYDSGADGADEAVLSSNLASAEFADRITFYTGTESQLADPLVTADERYKDTGAPAYRGRAYLVFEDFQLEKFGNRIPLTIEVEMFTHGVGGGAVVPLRALAPHKPFSDSAPAHVAYHIAGDKVYSLVPSHDGTSEFGQVDIYTHRYNQARKKVQSLVTTFPGLNATPGFNYIRPAVGTSDYASMVVVDVASDLWALDVKANLLQPLELGLPSASLAGFVSWTRRATTLIVKYVASAASQQIWTFDGTSLVQGYAPALTWKRKRHLAGAATPLAQDVTLSPDGRTAYFVHLDGTNVSVYSFEAHGDDVPARVFEYPSASNTRAQIDATTAGVWVYDGTRLLLQLDAAGRLLQAYDAPYGATIAAVRMMVGALPLLVSSGDEDVWHVPVRPVIDSVDVGSIVADVASRVGVVADVSDVAGKTITGYIRSRTMPARAAVEPLQQVHPFDIVESGRGLRVVRRGQSPAVTIEGDTVVSGREYKRTRVQDLELPRRIVVQYLSKDADYQPGTQQAQRIVTHSAAEAVLELPMVLADDQAAQTAEVLLYQSWQSRESVSAISLPPQYAALEPADVMVLRDAGRELRLRLVKIGFTAPGLLDVAGAIEDEAVYESDAVGGLVEVPDQIVRYAGATDLVVLDTHLLRDANHVSGVYIAASGGSGWRGAQIYLSANDLDWRLAGVVTAPATTGRLTTALAAGPTTVVDEGNRVRVEMYDGQLTSTDETGFLSGVNAALIGDEVVLFRTATLLPDGQYELAGLSRGRRGTEQHMTHAAGDRFILLTTVLADIAVSADARGRRLYVRAVGEGQSIGDALSQDIVFDNHRSKPWAPANLAAAELASGDYAITWEYRPRIGGEWADGTGVPVIDDPLRFEVQTWRAGAQVATATVDARTITLAAQPGDEIRVAQHTTDYGRGYASTVTL